MNSAKTLLVVAVLLAIVTGSYLFFNRPEPPAPLADELTIPPDTNPGEINRQISADTGDMNPKASGGDPPPWNWGDPVDTNSQRLGAFPSENRSFDQHGSGSRDAGQHEQFGSRFTPKSTANGSRFAQPDSIPDSRPSDNNFGSPRTVTLPLPKSDFGQTEFDSRGVSDRARAEAPDFSAAMGRAQDLMDQNRLAEALGLLSQLYEHPKLSTAEHRELNAQLDQLAGTVVYSSDYFVDGRPYKVQRGESLKNIADTYHVPWELLAKINAIDDPNRLLPGQELKVIKGPFKATINFTKRHLTLWLGDDYAGRFPLIEVKGTAPQNDTFVRTKNRSGDRFIELANNVRICGPRHIASTTGCTAVLSQEDVDDLFDILKVSSDVSIRR